MFADQVINQFGPLDAGLDLDLAFGAVELHDAIEGVHVEQNRIAAELLAAHRMPAAGDADRPTVALRVLQRRLQRVEGRRLHDLPHARGVELGLHVVDFEAHRLRSAQAETMRRQPEGGAELDGRFDELAACRHRAPYRAGNRSA